MTVSSSTAARAALAFVLVAIGGAAVAQGASPAKKPLRARYSGATLQAGSRWIQMDEDRDDF